MISIGAFGANTINTMSVAQARFIVDMTCKVTVNFKNKNTLSFLFFHSAPNGQKIIVPRDNRHTSLAGGS